MYDPLDCQTEQEYKELSSILYSLGNITALKIFLESAKGFKSGNEIVDKLGVNRRKYYRYLKNLSDLGMIDSLGKDYYLTPKGKHFHKILFGWKLQDSDYLAKLDSIQNIGRKNQIIVLDDYSNLINLMNTLINQSTHEILLATKYLDLTVIQHLVQAINRDVKVKSVTDKNIDFPGFFKLLSIFAKNIRPNLIRFYRNESNYKVGDVPLSFIIIDNNICVFEFPSREFQIAFLLTDKRSLTILSNYFLEIWNRSDNMKIPDIHKKMFKKDILYTEKS